MKTKRQIISILCVMMLVLIIPCVSAELFIGSLDPAYNIGDELDLRITLSSNRDASGFLVSKLICFDVEGPIVIITNETNSSESNETVLPVNYNGAEIYKTPVSIDDGEEKDVSVSIKLDKFLIGNLTGNCVIRSSYDNVGADSQVFELTEGLDVELDLSGVLFMPEEKFSVVGQAYKRKGEALEGFVEAVIPELNISVFGVVENGNFDFSFVIPRDTHAGKYELVAKAYERDINGVMINQGEAKGMFKVKQINERIQIALNSLTIVPENDFVYKIFLYDQAGDSVSDDVSVILYYPDGEIIEKKLIRAEESQSMHIALNDTPGYWKVEASLGDLKTSKRFYVEELQRISFNLINDTLVIENTGNVPYTKPIEISIGGVNEIIETEIGIGGMKKFKLSAPNGNYTIDINDGFESKTLGTSLLTGNAIAVKDMENLKRSGPGKIAIWIIVILILAAIALYLFRKVIKKPYSGKPPKGGIVRPEKLGAPPKPGTGAVVSKPMLHKPSIKSRVMAMIPKRKVAGSAETGGGIDEGQRQECAVVCLKIKNAKEIKKGKDNAMTSINRALLKAKSAKAKIYIDGDYRVIIFAPLITKGKENNLRAVKIAKEIEEIINAHNKVYSPKIKFGIGVNSGDMVVESKGKKFKFTSLGNTISGAKKTSEVSNAEIMLSESLHKKVRGSVRSEQAKGYWRVKKVLDRESHSKFIKGFLERQKKEKQKEKEKSSK